MNAWGVAGCREHLDEIEGWLREGSKKWGLAAKIKNLPKAIKLLGFTLDALQPFRTLAERAISQAEANQTTVLFRFPHGWGDCIQFRVVLEHLRRLRQDLTIDVQCQPDFRFCFRGLCREAYGLNEDPRRHYGVTHFVEWKEPRKCYPDTPSTKAEQYLRDELQITPHKSLCRYGLTPGPEALGKAEKFLRGSCEPTDGKYPVVILNDRGRTSQPLKNLPDSVAAAVVDAAQSAARIVLLADWHGREIPGAVTIPEGLEPETFAAVASLCELVIGIDSGPTHTAAAVGANTIVCWTGHHPLHYFGTNENAFHLVPQKHARLIRGCAAGGLGFFQANYGHIVHNDLEETLRATLRERFDGSR